MTTIQNVPTGANETHKQRKSTTLLRARLGAIEQQMAVLESQMTLLRGEREEILQDLAVEVYPILGALERSLAEPRSARSREGSFESREGVLSRSQPLPLVIQMDTDPLLKQPALEWLSALTSERSRFGYVEMKRSRDEQRTLFAGSMPALRHFDLSTHQPIEPPITFPDVPLLRSALLGVAAAYGVILPWRQLTTLATLTGVYIFEAGPILQQTPSLVHCTLVLLSDPFGENTEELVEFQRLESLVIMNSNGQRPRRHIF
ncbi:hypothetical protein C8R43DRAFT_1192570 [Mycena crocata]|nr:hypothetical protein C8R43DRAFT_1192570 [Mycena crocata]